MIYISKVYVGMVHPVGADEKPMVLMRWSSDKECFLFSPEEARWVARSLAEKASACEQGEQ